MSSFYPYLPKTCANCGAEDPEVQDCIVSCDDCGWQTEVEEVDTDDLEYSRPWGIDHSVSHLPYWQIINTETGRTKKIGPVQSKGINYFDRTLEECEKRNNALNAKQIKADLKAVRRFIRDVQDLDRRGWEKFKPYDHDHDSSFHLSRCVNCKAPTFQYRCPLCFWGPEESSIRAHENSYRRAQEQGEPMSFDDFYRRFLRYEGNYAPLAFLSNKNTVAYSKNPVYAEMTEWLIREAHNLDHPDLATIWRLVKKVGTVTKYEDGNDD